VKRLKVQIPLWAAVLTGFTVFLYELFEVIGKIQSWEVLWNPPTVSQMGMALVAGLVAILAALGVHLPAIFNPLLQMVGMQAGAEAPADPSPAGKDDQVGV
jgi:hypothetical protein